MQCIVANIDITIYEGGTFDRIYQWKTGVPLAPVDLTGFTAHMQIRERVRSETVLLDVPFRVEAWVADAETGIFIPLPATPDADSGKYRIYLKDQDTLGLCAAHKDITGAYDLFIYNADEEAVLKQYGVATIIAAVTRDDE